MRTIIAGSRSISDYPSLCKAVCDAINHGLTISQIVSGGAPGVDTLGEQYAKDHDISLKIFKPNYDKYDKWQAPKIRNTYMADYVHGCGALITLWDGKSGGTKHMIGEARMRTIDLYIYIYVKGEVYRREIRN